MPNCKKCFYRKLLALHYDIHIDERDCDKKGQDLCKQMNDPKIFKWENGGNKDG